MLKKSAIKKAIRSIEKSYDYHSYNGKYDVLVDLDELVDLIVGITILTTTEAEIMAMAYEEYEKEAMKKLTELELKNECYTVTDCKIILRKLTEKLKEELYVKETIY